MVDPVTSKAGSAAAQKLTQKNGVEGSPAIEKQGPSKFDAVQGEAAARTADARLPPPVEKVSEADRKQLIGEVRLRMEANPKASPLQVFAPEMATQSERIEQVRKRAEALPKSPFSDAVTQRLDQIDTQFRSAGSMLNKIPSMSDPRSLLQLQMQLYQVTQNVEIVSKAVEQVNSGVKQVLQTQL